MIIKSCIKRAALIPALIVLMIFQNCAESSPAQKSQMVAGVLVMQSYMPSTNQIKNLPADTADTITSAPNHTGLGFQDSALAINGVRGAGFSSGSGDVFSLTKSGSTASVTLEWKNKRIINGQGIDFIVFENPFYYNGDSTNAFMEALIVEVSQDNINYCGFSPVYSNSNKSEYSRNPIHWQRFAGITPVLYNVETNPLSNDDLYNLSKSGGDGFDLDDLSASNFWEIGCSTALRDKIKTEGFLYIRLTSATNRINPDTGQYFLQDSAGAYGGGPDIDGIIARYRVSR